MGTEPATLHADHRVATAGNQEAHRGMPEVPAVLGVEGDRVRAAKLVADVLIGNRHAKTAFAEAPVQLGFDLPRQVDFRESHVPVLVALDVFQLDEFRGIELVDETLCQDGDAEVAARRAALDDRALDDVADRRERGRSERDIPRRRRSEWRRRPSRCRAQDVPPCGPSPPRRTSVASTWHLP
jgi:hypothetical protein